MSIGHPNVGVRGVTRLQNCSTEARPAYPLNQNEKSLPALPLQE